MGKGLLHELRRLQAVVQSHTQTWRGLDTIKKMALDPVSEINRAGAAVVDVHKRLEALSALLSQFPENVDVSVRLVTQLQQLRRICTYKDALIEHTLELTTAQTLEDMLKAAVAAKKTIISFELLFL
jgi:hypothetical protein